MEFTAEKVSHKATIPVEPPQDDCFHLDDDQPFDDKRVWIGNIDVTVPEYLLLKLTQQCGDLKKFDFVYHKSGPELGKPRGFCFVTYSNSQAASKATVELHGRQLKSRKIIVRLANRRNNSTQSNANNAKSSDSINKISQIAALEAKLRLMQGEETTDVKTKLSSSIKPPSLLHINTTRPKEGLDPKSQHDKSKHKHSSKAKPYDR